MKKWRKYHQVELITADLPQVLKLAAKENIEIYELEQPEGICHRLKIRPEDYPGLERICEKTGSAMKLIRRTTRDEMMKGIMERPVLILGILLLAALTWFLPRRVLFFQVEGNEALPARQILEAAEKSGLCFGASARDVRSEKVKNSLLDILPELQWVGVNLRGCVAVIQVREREEPPARQEAGFGHIVAARDGVISQCTAYRGNLLCRPGEAVTQGQLLISGFTDTGLVIRAEQASGEIFAMTNRQLEMILPRSIMEKSPEGPEGLQISLRLGKKRINLWKNSGISSTTCDRMYKEYYVTLPGGFRLPGALVVETFQECAVSSGQIPDARAEQFLRKYARDYLLSIMNAGVIQDAALDFRFSEGEALLAGEYHCMEMIGKMQRLEIGEKDE